MSVYKAASLITGDFLGLTLEEMAQVFGDPVNAIDLGTPTNEKDLGPETRSIQYAEKA
jgi:hypothetical protein